jgi:hypothetical protein
MAAIRLFLFALAGMLLTSVPAYSQAVLLFDNGPMDYVNGFEMTEWTEAEDFEVPFSSIATRVVFGMGDTTCTFPANWDGHLRWWIHLDSGGLPGAVVATGFAQEVNATLDFDNCPLAAWYDVSFKFGQMPQLTVGVRYWLALHMAADWSARDNLYWATTSPGNFSFGAASHWGTQPWEYTGMHFAFRISAVGDDRYIFVDGFESGDT